MGRFNSFSAALTLCFALMFNLVVQTIAGIVLAAVNEVSGEENTLISAIAMLFIQGANLLAVFVATRLSKARPKANILGLKPKNTIFTLAITAILIVCSLVCTHHLTELISRFCTVSTELEGSGVGMVIMIITVICVAPVCEELVFRYACFSGWKEDFGTVGAIVVSSVAFALAHMSPVQIFYQLVLGVFLALIMHKTKNLSYCVIAHAFSNLLGVLSGLLAELNAFLSQNPWTVFVGIAVFVIGIFGAILLCRRLNPHEVEQKEEKEEERGPVAGSVVLIVSVMLIYAVFVALAFVPVQ